MELGTATLFDLPAAPAAAEVKQAAEPTPPSPKDEALVAMRASVDAIAAEQLNQVRMIADWADAHTVDLPEDASTITDRGLDTGLPVAGDGAPLISDFAVTELCAVLGRSLDSGRSYVGQVVELAHRLPGIWAGVLAGRVPTWKALRIADHTRTLPAPAAEFVDRQLARFAGGCTWAQIERLVDEALTRFDPEAAEEKRKQAAEHRRLDVRLDHAGTGGTVAVDGSLDLADALDVEQAIRDRARALGDLGCDESLDVRRSMALGEMARRDLTLDLNTGEISGQDGPADGGFEARKLAPQPPTKRPAPQPPKRKVELSVHLSDAAVSGQDNVGRLGNTQTPVTAEQIREWCGSAGTIIVRPVIDINGHEPTSAYEIAERQARQVLLREHRCIFPGCTRKAERCDLDHRKPHGKGGVTCPCNLAPLCRTHHRAKTHAGWTYETLAPSVYLWTGPTGFQWIVTQAGTRMLGRPVPSPAADPPDE